MNSQLDSARPHRVTFSLSRTEPDGAVIQEERTVECSADKLREIIAEPWEAVPRVGDTSNTGAQRLLATIAGALQNLRLVVQETAAQDGTTAWEIGFAGDDRGRASPAVSHVDEIDPQNDPPLQFRTKAVRSGRLEADLSGTLSIGDDAGGFSMHSPNGCTNGIEVHKHGMCVIDCDNVYAIVNLALNLSMQGAGRGESPAA